MSPPSTPAAAPRKRVRRIAAANFASSLSRLRGGSPIPLPPSRRPAAAPRPFPGGVPLPPPHTHSPSLFPQVRSPACSPAHDPPFCSIHVLLARSLSSRQPSKGRCRRCWCCPPPRLRTTGQPALLSHALGVRDVDRAAAAPPRWLGEWRASRRLREGAGGWEPGRAHGSDVARAGAEGRGQRKEERNRPFVYMVFKGAARGVGTEARLSPGNKR